MPDVIFTIGYQQRSIDEFVALASDAGVQVLVDVREKAWSHKPGFSKTAFSAALAAVGIEYVHARFAGNPKEIRRNASDHANCLSVYAAYLDQNDHLIVEFEALLARILSEGKRLALTCFERHPQDCHRNILAERWAARCSGRDVEHIAPDGCPRMISA